MTGEPADHSEGCTCRPGQTCWQNAAYGKNDLGAGSPFGAHPHSGEKPEDKVRADEARGVESSILDTRPTSAIDPSAALSDESGLEGTLICAGLYPGCQRTDCGWPEQPCVADGSVAPLGYLGDKPWRDAIWRLRNLPTSPEER